MKAFVKHGRQPYAGSLTHVERPEPGAREVLIKIAGCGVCGSDLHAYRADPGYEWVHPPVILGHEFTGTVIAAGSAVEHYRTGDRVAVIGIQGCLECAPCRDGRTNLCSARKVIGLDLNGGMAEYATVNEAYLIEVPDKLDLTLAALTEPLSVALHALGKVRIRPGQKVTVTGPGPIGIMCAALARAAGAEVVLAGTDADEFSRLPAARRIGLTAVNVDSEHMAGFLRQSQDIWIEASGSAAALESAIKLMPRGGEIIVVAMYCKELSWFPTTSVRAEHTYYFSYASSFRDYRQALDLLSSGKIELESLAVHYPLDQAEKAFEAAEKGFAVKAVLVPGDMP